VGQGIYCRLPWRQLRTLKCVGKVYKEPDLYRSAKTIYNEFKVIIRDLGPSHVRFDDALSTLFMSYIQCPTLMNILKTSLASKELESHQELEKACAACEVLLASLRRFNVVHGDMHAENILMCNPSTNSAAYECRMIDFDSLQACRDGNECSVDRNYLINSITNEIVMLRVRRRQQLYRTCASALLADVYQSLIIEY